VSSVKQKLRAKIKSEENMDGLLIVATEETYMQCLAVDSARLEQMLAAEVDHWDGKLATVRQNVQRKQQ